MKSFIIILLLLLVSCSTLRGQPKFGKSQYNFQDVSGSYRLIRETKMIKQKLVSRTQLISSNKIVEKSITVSQIGSVKAKSGRVLTLRPLASEFTVWLEGKKYTSKMNLHPETRSMKVTLDSPESQWNGTKNYPFPKGKRFCFFSQVPDCLHHSRVLELALSAPEQKHDFYVLWDAFPYIKETYTGISDNLFAPASLKFDGKIKNLNRFVLEIDGQIILYYFSNSNDFVKMTWIAQGITVVPPGEEIKEELE